MRHVTFLLFAACLSSAAFADELIDYEAVLAKHAEQVKITSDATGKVTQKSLNLPDGIVVECNYDDAEGSCWASDSSEAGALGCVAAIVVTLSDTLQNCPAQATTADVALLDRIETSVGAMIAANAVPPRDWVKLRPLFQELSGSGPYSPEFCSEVMAPKGDVIRFLDYFRETVSKDDLEKLLGRPRLPVMNPCF